MVDMKKQRSLPPSCQPKTRQCLPTNCPEPISWHSSLPWMRDPTGSAANISAQSVQPYFVNAHRLNKIGNSTYASKLPWCFANNAKASSVSPASASTVPQQSSTFKLSPRAFASSFAFSTTALASVLFFFLYSASTATAAKSGVDSWPLTSFRTSSYCPRAMRARHLRIRAGS